MAISLPTTSRFSSTASALRTITISSPVSNGARAVGSFSGQGLFLNTQVETPFGPIRSHEGSVFRLDPRVQKLEVFTAFGYSNVWGVVFDDWGQGLIADASPAMNYYMSHHAGRYDYPKKGKYDDYIARRGGYSFTPTGRRPSCGNELLGSEHFPEEVRNWYVTNQMKGWHGLRWYRLKEEGSGYASDQPRGEEELLTSSDTTFRPVAQQIGPDGALYVLDYYNPIVGHTTYNFRDPRHIKTHGRVWRVTAKDRELVWQPKIRGESGKALLEILKDPVNSRWRYYARRELQQRSPAKIERAVKAWIPTLSDERHLTEALWLLQGINRPDIAFLKKRLASKNHNARTAAVRVLRYWQETMPPADSLALLDQAITDESQRVRLEAMVALGYHPQPGKAVIAAAKALDLEMDPGFQLAAKDTLSWLSKHSAFAPESVDDFLLPHLPDDELLTRSPSEKTHLEILNRPQLPEAEHRSALMMLGRKEGRKTSIDELLHQLEKNPKDQSETTRQSLNALLLKWSTTDFVNARAVKLRQIAANSPDTTTKANARAMLMRLGDPVELNPKAPASWLATAALAGRGRLPADTWDTVSGLVKNGTGGTRSAALKVLPLYPDHDEDALKILAQTADAAKGNMPLAFAALDAMKRIPAAKWPPEFANRTLTRIRITATPNLRFAPDEFTVKVGSAVELTLFNPDNLYHNLAIIEGDQLERIGLAADMMAADPDGLKKHYVPDDPAVLHFTPQLTIGSARTHKLQFYAPEKPGNYPYICTYPGHWRAMKGVMKVVE